MNLSKLVGLVILVAICCTLSACSTAVQYKNTGRSTESVESAKKNGPPPHAPAHGYRHKHDSVVLEYDTALEVYAVSGWPNHYFYKDRYYRATHSGWEITAKFDGPWKSVATKKLPKGLKKSGHAQNSNKKKK